ncbi:hypothetical protein LTR33_000736 [Friedmanniomyces endolithicus]|nr:hypothetical protein LTR33_000736 [Friedmanniomyces endolithicus]
MVNEQSRQRNQAPASAPPPGSIIPVPRVRPLTTANGARVPYTRAELGQLFQPGPIQQSIFSNLDPWDAVSLRHAVHARDQNGGLLRISNTTCQDANLGFPHGRRDVLHRGYVTRPPTFEPPWTTRTPCNRVAIWTNLRTARPGFPFGLQELSLCREPALPIHHHNPDGNLRVCKPCKDKRFADFTWRRRQLWFGVCNDCRVYANSLTILTDWVQCDCDPNGRWTNSINGNEERAAHVCLLHDYEEWSIYTVPRAQTEINTRYRLRFRKKPPRLGYKKSKKAIPRNQMTPAQRRGRMKLVPTSAMRAAPRCYCGNVMSDEDHARPNGRTVTNSAGLLMPIYQWRHCTGCNNFVNTSF